MASPNPIPCGFVVTNASNMLSALSGSIPGEFPMLWWYRIIPYRSYVKGWKISPSHYLNQDLATVWLDK